MLRFLIPAYNEEGNIELLVKNTAEYADSRNYEYEIVIVNDGSTDNTMAILKGLQKSFPIVILDQVVNKGVGEAFNRGFRYMTDNLKENDIIITKEADNTSDLSILDDMISKINGGSDLVLASCYMPGGGVRGTNLYRKILSAGANILLKMATSLKGVHTFSSFYRAYRAVLIKRAGEVYNDRLIEEKGFSCMVELLLKLSRLDINITEVPMVLSGDMRKGKSKMKTVGTIAGYIKLIARNLPDKKRNIITLCGFGLLGLLLRLIFIPFTMHQDMLWIHMCASKMAYYGVYNIYGYIKAEFYSHIFSQGINYYPPLTYFLLGIFHCIVKPLMPGLGAWLDIYSGIAASGNYSNYLDLFKIPAIKLYSYVSVMKAPYFIADILCSVLLWKYFTNMTDKIRAFKFWMINPVVIFGSYIFGQFDIMVVLFLLMALYLMGKGRIYIGMFVIGCACLLKSSPILLILPLALILGRSAKERFLLLTSAATPILIVMSPFYMLTGNYALTALFPNFIHGGGASLLDTVEFSASKLLFAIVYVFIIARLIIKSERCDGAGFDEWRYLLGIILLSYFIVFTPIHYFQWAIPFIIIGIVNKNIPRSVYLLQIACLFVYAICSRPLSGQLFTPVNPEYFYDMISIPEYMNQFMKWGVVMRVARLIFDCCSLYMIWRVIFKPEVKNA